jgi:hypothetical protein
MNDAKRNVRPIARHRGRALCSPVDVICAWQQIVEVGASHARTALWTRGGPQRVGPQPPTGGPSQIVRRTTWSAVRPGPVRPVDPKHSLSKTSKNRSGAAASLSQCGTAECRPSERVVASRSQSEPAPAVLAREGIAIDKHALFGELRFGTGDARIAG